MDCGGEAPVITVAAGVSVRAGAAGDAASGAGSAEPATVADGPDPDSERGGPPLVGPSLTATPSRFTPPSADASAGVPADGCADADASAGGNVAGMAMTAAAARASDPAEATEAAAPREAPECPTAAGRGRTAVLAAGAGRGGSVGPACSPDGAAASAAGANDAAFVVVVAFGSAASFGVVGWFGVVASFGVASALGVAAVSVVVSAFRRGAAFSGATSLSVGAAFSVLAGVGGVTRFSAAAVGDAVVPFGIVAVLGNIAARPAEGASARSGTPRCASASPDTLVSAAEAAPPPDGADGAVLRPNCDSRPANTGGLPLTLWVPGAVAGGAVAAVTGSCIAIACGIAYSRVRPEWQRQMPGQRHRAGMAAKPHRLRQKVPGLRCPVGAWCRAGPAWVHRLASLVLRRRWRKCVPRTG